MPKAQPTRSPEWWRKDAERNERARRARLQRDAQKPAGQNLEEGADFVRFAQEFAEAFARVRAMKRAADRPLDRADLEQLDVARGGS